MSLLNLPAIYSAPAINNRYSVLDIRKCVGAIEFGFLLLEIFVMTFTGESSIEDTGNSQLTEIQLFPDCQAVPGGPKDVLPKLYLWEFGLPVSATAVIIVFFAYIPLHKKVSDHHSQVVLVYLFGKEEETFTFSLTPREKKSFFGEKRRKPPEAVWLSSSVKTIRKA